MKISIIIPALNEEHQIEDALRSLCRQEGPYEILVVDGGSTDDTVLRASRYARVLHASRGRSFQMNRGAKASTGEVLLFLHADSRLPEGGLAHIREVLTDPDVEAGTFRLRFDQSSPLLRFYGWCTRFRIPQICFGDRGLFVRRSAFRDIGGFPEISVFEDLEIVAQLARRGGFRFLPHKVTTAARRFVRNGAARQQLLNALLWTGYMVGIPPARLRRFYSYRRG